MKIVCMADLPTQTSENSRRRRSSSFNTSEKIGSENIFQAVREKAMKNAFKRKMFLTVPDEISAANPDKHFVYVNYNKLQASGGWHQEGYRLFKVGKDPEALDSQDFSKTVDGLVHRKEMALAYLPKAEYEERQLEARIIRGDRDLSELISRNPNLAGFNPTGKETIEKVALNKGE